MTSSCCFPSTLEENPVFDSLCFAAMLFAVYVVCMFALYSFMPVVVEMTSATAVNLSLLTADLFSLFCGIFLFHYTVSCFCLCHIAGSMKPVYLYTSYRTTVEPALTILCAVCHPQFSTLYIISFVVITFGFVMFNAVPTYSALPGSSSSDDEPSEGLDDQIPENSSDHQLSADRDSHRAEMLTAVAAL